METALALKERELYEDFDIPNVIDPKILKSISGGRKVIPLANYRPRLRKGYLAGGEERGIVKGFFRRLKNYWSKKIKEYTPIRFKGLFGNLKDYAYYTAASWGLGKISEGIGNRYKNAKKIIDGWKNTYKELAITKFYEWAPGIEILLDYSEGKTQIDKMYVYIKNGQKVPIFFTTLKDPKDPTLKELQDGIQYVETKNESPFNHMAANVSEPLLNEDFKTYAADLYTGTAYSEHFHDEPDRIHRWFVKEDTKVPWTRDSASEAYLPTAVQGKVEVYKKPVHKKGILNWLGKLGGDPDKPRSSTMFWHNLKGDFWQDVSYWGLGGAILATARERFGIVKERIRAAMENYYKIGSNLAGPTPWLAYELA